VLAGDRPAELLDRLAGWTPVDLGRKTAPR
jgi:hypothetical protein